MEHPRHLRAQNTTKTAAVSSEFHPVQTCTTCVLCGKTGGYFTQKRKSFLFISAWVWSLHLTVASARPITPMPDATALIMSTHLSGRDPDKQMLQVFQHTAYTLNAHWVPPD